MHTMSALIGFILSRSAHSFSSKHSRILLKSKIPSLTTLLRHFTSGTSDPPTLSTTTSKISYNDTLNEDDRTTDLSIPISYDEDEESIKFKSISSRPEDFVQLRELDQILTERAARFYDPNLVGIQKEKCILISVEIKLESRKMQNRKTASIEFTHLESLSELSELVGTAGLQVMGSVVQKLGNPNAKTYVGPGKIADIMALVNETQATTLVIDDDLAPKQQRNLEDAFAANGGRSIKILDRTAIILEIFAQHAKSREGQLQVELAMLEYRLTRGPSASGDLGRDSGAGFRGPGESKLETDKRLIRDKIVLVKEALVGLKFQREHHREGRKRLGLPVVALVGYTNAGKSTLLNRLSRAGVLAENMLFATLDPTTRRVVLPKKKKIIIDDENDTKEAGRHNKGQEVLLTDTVGFISKLPTDLIAAFRATLEEVQNADVLIHVCDRSSTVWRKQRETVLKELDNIGCFDTPVVELWNKIDALPNPDDVMLEAATLPIDTEVVNNESEYEAAVTLTNIEEQSKVQVISLEDEDDSDEEYEITARDVNKVAAEFTADEDLVIVSKDSLRGSFRPERKIFTVAASALTGVGFDDFLLTLNDALSLLLRPIEVFIPYDKDDGIVARIHSQGSIDEVEYRNSGTRLICKVPDSLYMRLKPFQLNK